MAFESKDEAMVWMIDNQRGRRNLKPGQLAELGLKRASILEERAKENQMAGLMQGTEKPVSLTLDKREQIDTLQSAADYSGLSRATVAKAKKVFAEAPEEIKEEVRTGKTSINKAYQEVRRPRTAAGKNNPRRVISTDRGKEGSADPWPSQGIGYHRRGRNF